MKIKKEPFLEKMKNNKLATVFIDWLEKMPKNRTNFITIDNFYSKISDVEHDGLEVKQLFKEAIEQEILTEHFTITCNVCDSPFFDEVRRTKEEIEDLLEENSYCEECGHVYNLDEDLVHFYRENKQSEVIE